jgi:tetratricopeptide (TPR) repeat protein
MTRRLAPAAARTAILTLITCGAALTAVTLAAASGTLAAQETAPSAGELSAPPSDVLRPDSYVAGPMGLRGGMSPATYRALRDSLWRATRTRDVAAAYRLGRSLTEAWPLDPGAWGRLALAAEASGHPREALDAYDRAFSLGTGFQTFVAIRAASVAAGLGEREAALSWIRRALDARLENRSSLQTMKAFASLRSDPVFRELAGFPPDTTRPRDARWRYDIEYLVAEAHRLHASPERQAFSPAFERAAAALEDSVLRLSDEQIFLGLQRVVALLGDGHSVVYGIREGEGPSARAFLPVVFWQFDDGLFVVDADPAHRGLIGSRVVAFGGVPPDKVLARLAPVVNHDNAMTIRWLGVRFYMRNAAWLRAVGASRSADSVALTLATAGGAERTVVLRPSHRDLPRKLRWPWRYEQTGAAAGGGAHGPPPLWLQDADTNYWMRWLPERRILYVQFNQVRDQKDHPLSAFARELRATIDSTGTRTVVVDARRNNGGNNGLLEPLLRTLAWFDSDRPGNRLFLLTSRNTFSAAQNFVDRVDWRTDAILVGEPTASKPNVAGEDTHVVLPYSRAVLSISSRYWQDSDPGDRRPWIAPDMPVGLTSADYFAGRDPAMEAVFAVLEADRARAGG